MVYLISILIYLLVLTGIGIYKSRQVRTQADFAVAGRTLSPWIMVCTMLAVWIGTGSIVANAEEAYRTGMAALVIPTGVLFGMILLSLAASRVRNIEATSVPEIIGSRFGQIARALAVVALVLAYMVIVSYQFNAGGAVLEVITGDKPPVAVQVGDTFRARQIQKGVLVYFPRADWKGSDTVRFEQVPAHGDVTVTIHVVEPNSYLDSKKQAALSPNTAATKVNTKARIVPSLPGERDATYRIAALPEHGRLEHIEPILTKQKATIIAACFIILYTMLAGLKSLAYTDIVNGTVIMVTLAVTFPLYWIRAGGWSGMETAFAQMGDKPHHMQLWGVYSATDLVNFLLPIFLLILGDANQYQRIFASRSAKGARTAVTTMIFVAYAIELLIIACAWIAASQTPDPDDGRYILIHAAKHLMPTALGCVFMITVVGIIISTADSFLLVPATTFIKDVYLNYVNRNASEKRVVFLSRLLVVVFGLVAYGVSLMFAQSTGFFQKALYAYTIYGAAITPCLVAALFWSRATKQGAIASILTGTITTLVWSALDKGRFPAWAAELDAVLPAITLSVLALVLVSLLTRKRPAGPS
ncbi:MAG: sodium:solute symporter family protein [Sedimentisphaerales bacterium]|jgi:Na+/proline symporter|nr:sodium:solute symporter family protein [Sedimentisphaerales bacterium]NLF67014.1 sodium:solute symporter family protein [Chloroflexota bacterium]HNY76906.1 sodium:solute symporter family protein [Sedimentisphaerales bacterium]HOC62760.1 sodium:solute symporter family protein [Sedimentisphaerales bacterium]HOH62680.1 sodium:solute symporter family protein [Sedimentisphaerales bacterium]